MPDILIAPKCWRCDVFLRRVALIVGMGWKCDTCGYWRSDDPR